MARIGPLDKIKIDVNEERTLRFSFDMQDADKYKTIFKFVMELPDAEYGFTGSIEDGEAVIHLPPLFNVIPNGVGGTFSARLEAVVNEQFYMIPWREIVEINYNPAISVINDSEEIKLKEPINLDIMKKEIRSDVLKDVKAEIEAKVDSLVDELKAKSIEVSQEKVKKIKVDLLRDMVDSL